MIFHEIVCWQTILMKYHTLFFSKIKKDVKNLSPAAVVIGALRVKVAFFCKSANDKKHAKLPNMLRVKTVTTTPKTFC